MENKTVPNSLPILQPHSSAINVSPSNSGITYAQEPINEEKNLISPDDGSAMAMSSYATPIEQTQKPSKWYQDLRAPYVMITMSSLQICLYLIIANKKTIHLLLFDPHRQVELWRFISYMLLHKDYVHLLQNVLLQCLFALYLESFERNWKILFVYVGGGIGGALGAASVRSDLLVGASAGVYALLLSCVSYIILNFQHLKYKYRWIVAVSTIIIFDIVYYTLHYVYNASPTISGGAHLFGGVMGLLIGLTLFSSHRRANDDKQQYPKVIFVVSIVLLILVLSALIIADVENTRINQAAKVTANVNVNANAYVNIRNRDQLDLAQ